ncbi:hypothetical protein AAFF_G00070950 [Aldrovandia affinis]|uniref:Uncharacterized protein n=1 Tax=Aldrovandia affinis TaxID=143900 RepID=A0AAD7WD98_9TELE|nr:hypothetical protein AAFF_G00070950 [Aldrovandia affinis]
MLFGRGGGRSKEEQERDNSYTNGNHRSISLSYFHSWRRKSTNTVTLMVEQTSKRERDRGIEKGRGDGGYWPDNLSVVWNSLDVTGQPGTRETYGSVWWLS